MSTGVIVGRSAVLIWRVVSWWLATLAAGWVSAASAGPVEDLCAAAYRGDAVAVQAMLARGVNVNAKESHGATALMYASQQGRRAVVQVLLGKGADANARDISGAIALMYAAREGHSDVAQALLARTAGVDTRDNNGSTALTVASFGGHLGVVQMLLARGADINARRTDNGATALILASENGHLNVVQALLAKGANIDAKANNGATALMYASQEGHADVAQALQAAGSAHQPAPAATSSPAPQNGHPNKAPSAKAAVPAPSEQLSLFVPITKPGETKPGIARVTASKLDSIEGNVIRLKADGGKTSGFLTDGNTMFCVHGKKSDSIKDIDQLVGQTVSVFTAVDAKPNALGQTYIFRVEDGSPQMTIGFPANTTDGSKGTISFPEKPCLAAGTNPPAPAPVPAAVDAGDHGSGRVACDISWQALHRPASEYAEYIQTCMKK